MLFEGGEGTTVHVCGGGEVPTEAREQGVWGALSSGTSPKGLTLVY